MLELQFPQPVIFICAFIYSKEEVYQQTKTILQKKFGLVDLESPAIKFTFTDYYQKEMGSGLKRRFISFKKLQKPDRFVGRVSRTKFSLLRNWENKENSRKKDLSQLQVLRWQIGQTIRII